ncbi:MAG: hypothetical protein A3C06_03110 [Candidatus Taylorbacteria bacterium RIFCSPHIGHO2_02_FULL_46_13]|uniref:Uncharacterized protein n=1 Tax=Candidatus Taylorbacteria bacterium RIFCSPHIGHO2_02_FULL_46_13 TaxID=1802312 RepID=A0A1G2MTH3_9BACT|nr:MAG: hypothetical protein A3C06_03110 [Candidatus Taylorbacteria bacterium RIFCSPHIGHO2_02_FULL_46_13]
MTTKLIEEQLHTLNQEVALLRSAVLSVVGSADTEGEYRPEFVSSVLARVHARVASHKFTNSKSFLALLRKKT